MTFMTRTAAYCCLLAAVSLVCGKNALADPPSGASSGEDVSTQFAVRPSIKNYLRLDSSQDDASEALQTAVVRFVPSDGSRDLVVDLIAAVHIADQGYYDKLNWIFEDYDVLLYEFVAPPDQRIPDPDRNADNPLRLIQKLSQSVLDLTHQLDHIDYTKENFVHADMSPKQMQRAMQGRGDNQMTVMLGIMADMVRQQNLQQRKLEENPEKYRELAEMDPLQLMLDPYGAIKLKRIMAQQFADLSGAGSGLGQTLDTILIKDRNKAAVRVLRQQIDRGAKRIGIFYGAAHMPDFEKRLAQGFGLRRERTRWLTAWDLRKKAKSPAEGLLRQVLEEALRAR